MGIFDYNCPNLLFTMECDVYYALEEQDEYGGIDKVWQYESTIPCSFYSTSDQSDGKNFTYNDDRFYKLESTLYGRTQTDPRVSSYGLFHPPSHILLTNIRATEDYDGSSFFIETDGEYVGEPTVFEINSCQPFVGPLTSVEYYKVQLERSDRQGIANRVEY